MAGKTRSIVPVVAIHCGAPGGLVDLQREMGGNALVGKELFPPSSRVRGFETSTSPPGWCTWMRPAPSSWMGLRNRRFPRVVEGVGDDAVRRRMMSRTDREQGIGDLYRTCEPDGVFCHTFFKAQGRK